MTGLLEVGEEASLSAALGAVSLAETGDAPAKQAKLLEVSIPQQFPADLIFDLERVAAFRDPDIGDDVTALPSWLANAASYEARMDAITALGDFLGAPEAAMAAIKSASAGGTRNRGLWLNIDRQWALNCMVAARNAEAGRLVAVDAALSAQLKHVPLLPDAPHDHRWVLPQFPRSREGVASGTRVLAEDPAAAATTLLPEFVLKALRSEAGHLALAGGAALAAVTAPEVQDALAADFDMFVYGFTGDADAVSASADALVRRVAALPGVMPEPRGAIVSRSAVTFVVKPGRGAVDAAEAVVQIILRVAKSPYDILTGFDLAPSKVCLLYESPDAEELTVLAAPDWPLAMRHGAYALDGRAWSRATALRVFKYAAKGFDALVPALTDRSRLHYRLSKKKATSWWSGDEKLAHLDGFELLYALERSIAYSIERDANHWKSWKKRYDLRILPKDVVTAARKLLMEQRTDYASALSTMSALVHALAAPVRYLHHVLEAIGAVQLPKPLDAPLGWRQPWSRAQFHPVVADVADALHLVDTAGP